MATLQRLTTVLLVLSFIGCSQGADDPESDQAPAPRPVQPNQPPAPDTDDEDDAEDSSLPVDIPTGTDWRELLESGAMTAGRIALGAEQGFLFYTYDMLTYPGENAELVARIHDGKRLDGLPDVTVTFYHDEQEIGSVVTDADGKAAVTILPEEVGDYFFTAAITDAPEDLGEEILAIPPTLLMVSAREKKTPFVVVDLDHTVVHSSFLHVLLGRAEPMADSQEVLARIAERYSLLYLTHRPEEMSRTTKQWLIDQGFPRAPLIMSRLDQVLTGSGSYKQTRLQDVRKAFPEVAIGIGDKLSDAEAYLANGMKAYLIPHYKREVDDMLEMADRLDEMTRSDRLNVVDTWQEVEVGIFHNITFPVETYVARLRRRAEEMAAYEEDDDDDDDDEEDDDD